MGDCNVYLLRMHAHALFLKRQISVYWQIIMKSSFIIFHIVLLRLKSSPHLLIINIIFEQIVQWDGFCCLLRMMWCRSLCGRSMSIWAIVSLEEINFSIANVYKIIYSLSDQRICVVPNHAWTFEPQFTQLHFNNDPLISE